ITTIWSDKKNCVFVFISVNLTGDSTIVFIFNSIVIFQVENFRNSLGLSKQSLVILCTILILQVLTLVIR
ncbi:hypothetical protein CEW18_09685, partial [Limosilactobacillus fermentum]